jgi:hypothetical protein
MSPDQAILAPALFSGKADLAARRLWRCAERVAAPAYVNGCVNLWLAAEPARPHRPCERDHDQAPSPH